MRTRLPLEAICWIAGLTSLYFLSSPGSSHFSLCPLSFLNTWCPGCGLGRSINFFLHGDLAASVRMHWFGIPAFFILSWRIFELIRKFLLPLKVT